MLIAFRRRARGTAAALLVAVVALAVPHSFDPHHDADAHGIVIHNATTHRLVASDSQQDDHALHCLACHVARSLRLGSTLVH